MSKVDSKILEHRLLTKDTSITDASSIKACAEKLVPLKERVDGQLNGDAIESFLRELLLFKLDLEKSYMAFEVCKRQNDEYEELQNKITAEISNAKINTTHLEEELIQQQDIRKHREECENLAKKVNSYPPRRILKRKYEIVEDSLKNNNESLVSIEEEIGKKKKMFDTLLQTISDLQMSHVENDNTASDEVEEEEEREEDEGRAAREDKRRGGDIDGNNKNIDTASGNDLEMSEEGSEEVVKEDAGGEMVVEAQEDGELS